RKPVPPNTVAVCASAQDAFIPYRYRSPTHVAADQFGCVCAIPTLSWNASASPAYLRSLSNFGGYGTVDRCLDTGQERKCASGSPRIDHRLVHLKSQRFEGLARRPASSTAGALKTSSSTNKGAKGRQA